MQYNVCGGIVASHLARRRTRHDKTSRASFVLTIHLKHTHARQVTDNSVGFLSVYSPRTTLDLYFTALNYLHARVRLTTKRHMGVLFSKYWHPDEQRSTSDHYCPLRPLTRPHESVRNDIIYMDTFSIKINLDSKGCSGCFYGSGSNPYQVGGGWRVGRIAHGKPGFISVDTGAQTLSPHVKTQEGILTRAGCQRKSVNVYTHRRCT